MHKLIRCGGKNIWHRVYETQPHGRSCISALLYGLWGYGAFWPRGGGKGGVNVSQSEWEGSLMPFNGVILHLLIEMFSKKGKLLLFWGGGFHHSLQCLLKVTTQWQKGVSTAPRSPACFSTWKKASKQTNSSWWAFWILLTVFVAHVRFLDMYSPMYFTVVKEVIFFNYPS